MKKIFLAISIQLSVISLFAQTLNVQVGNVTYQFPAAQAGSMPYENGTTLTVMGKSFTLSEVSNMYVDETVVRDSAVNVVYNGSSAAITVAGNIARYVTIAQSGAHVSIAQSNDLATEIIYNLSGTSTDGEFYTSGAYKTTLELNGLTLTNTTPVYSGAAVHVQNSKRIKVKVITGTTSTLRDASTGSQKGALYIKGHAEFAQKGTLNVYGNLKHGIKAGEYITVKNATINVLSSVGDGINREQFFLMQSGAITLSGIGDDGLQCDIEDTTTGSTGQTTDHEGEDSGNIYISGGTISVSVSAAAAKGLKAEGDAYITGRTITATTTGGGAQISGGTCKYTTSWTGNTWYALYNNGELAFVFKTPTKSNTGGGGPGGGGPGGGGSQKLVVYTSSTPTLKSGVTPAGTEIFEGVGYDPATATATGGSNVTLSNYSNSGGGPGGW